MNPTKIAAFWLLTLALPIAGCSLLPKPAPAIDAFVPRVPTAVRAAAPRYTRLTVPLPTAPVYLDTSEPQLIDTDGSWLRIAGFRFAATPAELLQNLLADGIEQSGLASAVLTRQADQSPKLDIELRAFAVERSQTKMHARLAYSIRLNTKPPRATRIDVEVPVASLGSGAVRAAWQKACEQALRETLVWLGEGPATEQVR